MLYQIFAYILETSFISIFIIAVVLLVRCLMCRMPKKYSYLLWAIVGIRLLCPGVAASPVSICNITKHWTPHPSASADFYTRSSRNIPARQPGDAAPVTDTSAARPQKDSQNHTPATVRTSENTATASRPVSSGTMPAARYSFMVRYGAPVWLGGMIVLLLWNFYRLLRMKKSLSTAVRYRQNIYECDVAPAPFVMGLIHPKVYLPFRLDQHELAYILDHELYHIRRRDHIIRPAAYILACVYWFHPLIWISYSLMGMDMEMSCDEHVLQNASPKLRRQYSQSLLAFASNQRLSAGPVAFGKTETGKRVNHVLNFRKHKKWSGVLAAAFIAVTATACLTSASNSPTSPPESGSPGNIRTDSGKTAASGTLTAADNKKSGSKTEIISDPAEAVLAETKIHGFQVQIVWLTDSAYTDHKGSEYGMYQGDFEIRTSKNGKKYAAHKLKFRFADQLYYPASGFELAVKDYDCDGSDDDFSIGQGQTPVPEAGNFMFYQFFSIEENGSILQNTLSTKEQTGILTIPGEFSRDFPYLCGSISYQALGENGVSEQTAHITTACQTPDGEVIQSFSDDEIQTAIKTVKKYFKKRFPGGCLREIWYNEAHQQRTAGHFKNQYQTSRVIILLSEFYTDNSQTSSSLVKDQLYTGFNWILAKNSHGEWEVRDSGY